MYEFSSWLSRMQICRTTPANLGKRSKSVYVLSGWRDPISTSDEIHIPFSSVFFDRFKFRIKLRIIIILFSRQTQSSLHHQASTCCQTEMTFGRLGIYICNPRVRVWKKKFVILIYTMINAKKNSDGNKLTFI